MEDTEKLLEERAKKASDQREITRTILNQLHNDLHSLFTQNPKKPRENLPELTKKIDELEYERTVVSLPLMEEKKILFKINGLERTKRQVEEYIDYEARVQEMKDKIQDARNLLKEQTDEVAELEASVAKEKLAKRAGCKSEQLKEKEVACPPERIGAVIGKNGATIKKIEETNKVALDVDSIQGKIKLYGEEECISNAMVDINRIIVTTEMDLQVPQELLTYFSTKHITAVTKLRDQHPDVYFTVSKDRKNKISVRGHPDDIEKVKNDMLSFDITSQQKRLTSQEALILIGKKGATIEKIVEKHEAAIDVEKDESGEQSTATISGPADCVNATMEEIEELLNANREITESITVANSVRQSLLLGAGVKIKELQSRVTKECGTAVLLSFGSPSADGQESNIIVKTKLSAMEQAIKNVKEAVSEIESSIVFVSFDPFVIPLIIGKGGETIRNLQEGKTVFVEVDRKKNQVAINGLDRTDVEDIEAKIRTIIDENIVLRIPVDSSLIEMQYRELTRAAKERNAIRALARLDIDKDSSEIVLRGSQENVEKAKALVQEFLVVNFIEEVPISAEDKDVLVSGGSGSIIVKLSKDLNVNLSVDRARFVLVVRGDREKVESAVKEINGFLHGGEGHSVSRISVTQESLGYVIGKGGKKRAALESKHEGVSIHIHGNNRITLRGPEDRVKDCRVDILKIIASARVLRSLPINENQRGALNKSNMARKITQSIPVQVSVKESNVEVRGFPADVRDAFSLLNEQINGVYETCVELDAAHLGKVRGACRDPSHFVRMNNTTGADVSLDLATGSIMIRGNRAQVKQAKLLVMRFLEFILSPAFTVVKLLKPLHSTVGLGSSLADIAAVSGATLYLDRDISSVVIQSFGKGKVEEASKLLNDKIKDAEKLVYFIQLEPDESWLIPMIIGRNGDLVNSIRKQSGCTIDISKEELSVLVTGASEDDVAVAKSSLERLVDKGRRETAFLDIPEEALPTFVGRSGAHIAEFSRVHNVEIQVMRKGPFKLKVQGEEKNVTSAKKAVLDWLTAWAQTVTFVKIQVEQNQIPAVLGKKGANIRSVEDEFGCRVELDRSSLTVTIRGGTTESRESASEKIKSFIRPATRDRQPYDSDYDDDRENRRSQPTSKNGAPKTGKSKEPVDAEAAPDRSNEFPPFPVGMQAGKIRVRGKKKSEPKKKDPAEEFQEGPEWDSSSGASEGISRKGGNMLEVEG